MNRPLFQSLILTLIFGLGLCLIGPLGSHRADPLSRWLTQQARPAESSPPGLADRAAAASETRAAPAISGLWEGLSALLAGALAVLVTARFSLPWALTGVGLLGLLAMALPVWIFGAAGILVTSSVPLATITFGLLSAALLIRPRPSTAEAALPPQSAAGAASGNPARHSFRGESQPLAGGFDPAGTGGDLFPEPGDAQAPMTIGRYEIIRPIGKGAMGEVFLGRDPHINRLTAIKTVHFGEAFADDDTAQARIKFFREAESAGALSHPHIVTIYDAGEDGDSAYIAMEFLEGSTLLRFARRKRLLPLRRLIRYLVQVADALDYAHAQGVIHRDIKPANIILMDPGLIKITDFGIARIANSSQTRTGVVKGTPYYMSPEQFSGQKVDGRSDIFSLGTSMFQLLTGTLPFYAESPALLMNQIMNFPHPNPRAINPRIIPAMVAIVDKTLRKERCHRYQTARELAADLRRLDQRIKAVLSKDRRPTPGDHRPDEAVSS